MVYGVNAITYKKTDKIKQIAYKKYVNYLLINNNY